MLKQSTLLLLAVLMAGSLVAQNQRFLDPIYEVGARTTVTYATNLDALAAQGGNPVRDLQADVYQPVGDDGLSLRPVVVMWPTGNFLPQYLNQGAYGSRRDSAVVEILGRLTASGYVGMAADYRVGWLPTSPDQEIRTATLLQAAYRGTQDANAMARYLRKTVADDGNPYRIDTSRIVFWGLGTGGYVAMNHAFLDDINEVLDDDRFYTAGDAEGNGVRPFVTLETFSNPQGTTAVAPNAAAGLLGNLVNHPGYSGSVAMSVNTGGALGSIAWIEDPADKPEQPLVIAQHSPNDPFAPYGIGTVIVPTTQQVVLTQVAGSQAIIQRANELGLNDALDEVNDTDLPDLYSDLAEDVNERNETLKGMMYDLTPGVDGGDIQLSVDNLYPLNFPGSRTIGAGASGASFNWIDEAAVRTGITQFNAATGQMINADAVIQGELATNPNAFDPAAARMVIDTIMAHFYPRAYVGLELATLVGTEDVVAATEIGLNISPNPAAESFLIETGEGFPIRDVSIFDINGRLVQEQTQVNRRSLRLYRDGLANGTYIVRIRVDEGVSSRKIFIR